jgi:DUF4097 and DUF4098 domain-containing protein YvlB
MRRETFTTPAPIRLDLRVPAGEVDVRSSETTETVVELEPLGSGADSAVAEARLELRDGTLVVDVSEERGFFLRSRNREVRLSVSCPTGCDVRVRAASADVTASGSFASVDLESASGDLELADTDGDATLKAASGDVTAHLVGGSLSAQSASGDLSITRVGGTASLRTASGDVEIGEADAAVTVQTASGDVRLASVSQGEVTVRSASGDIWVGIRQGSAVWVDAASMSGETTSELDVGDAPAEQEQGPLVELRAQTMSGDVHVARAAARTELER